MVGASDTLGFRLALVSALALGILAAGFATAPPRALAGPAPRVTLSVPAEVTQATPATAKGSIVPAQRGRVLLRVWRAHAWRAVAAGRVRQGKFRIAFTFMQ